MGLFGVVGFPFSPAAPSVIGHAWAELIIPLPVIKSNVKKTMVEDSRSTFFI
ncbi:MAG: hypothetical protein WAL66_10875 [Nitrososphaeraceae archaeon]